MPQTTTEAGGRRLRFPPAGLAAAVLLLAGPMEGDRLGAAMRGSVDELEALGVVNDGRLAPWAAHQLVLLLAPDVHVEVVVVTPTRTSVSQIWARPDAAIIGEIDPQGWVELTPTEPASLAWDCRSMIGLTVRAEPAVAPQPPIDLGRLARFEHALAIGDHAGASDLIARGERHAGHELAVMAALASADRRTWRVTARWTSAAGPVQRWLSALDAGTAGLWCAHGESHGESHGQSIHTTEPATESASGASPLVATSAADAWQHLVATLPPGTAEDPNTSANNRLAPHGRAPCPPSVQPSPIASSGS